MQKVLDELQNDIDNELEKVSLERLADINPDLLANIKQAAEDSTRGNQQNSSGGYGNGNGDEDKNNGSNSFFHEIRADDAVARSKAWSKLDIKHEAQTNELIKQLQTVVKDGSSPDSRYTQSEAIDMTRALATTSCAASLLSRALERRQTQDKKANKATPFIKADGGSSGFSSVDRSLFTNEGIKKRDMALIEMLYGVGLPFVSSSDGRRFKTQLELSKHLDRLFKKRFVLFSTQVH
jgi:pre-mRNA cleavage complex 2 protein Pcf11